MRKHIQATGERTKRTAAKTREGLRRVMPRVAMAGVVLCVTWLLVNDSPLYNSVPGSALFGLVTFLTVSSTII